jgi:hypothetical protein
MQRVKLKPPRSRMSMHLAGLKPYPQQNAAADLATRDTSRH